MHGKNRPDEEDDHVTRLVTRLQDLLVEEISTVDRAANKRRFLVVKTEGEDMPTGEEITELEDGTLITDVDKDAGDAFGTVDAGASGDDAGVDDASDGDKIEGADKATPKGVKETVMRLLGEAGSKLDALVAKLKAANGFVPPPLMGEAKAIVTILRGVSSRYPSPKAKSDEPADDAATDEATEVAKANAAAAATALAVVSGKIKALVAKVKGLEEGDGSLPPDVGKAVDAIAMGVEEALGLAKADTENEPAEEPGMSAQGTVVEAAKLLQVALGKLAAGKPCDDESLRMIKKARDVLAASLKAKTKTKKTEDEGEPTEDREPTEKAGTKQLSRARREKFKGALDSLIKLFEEMIPEAERKSMWPTRKAAIEPVQKNEGEIAELRKTIDEQSGKITKLQGVIKDHEDEPTDTNLVPLGKSDDDGIRGTAWEHDLNDPEADTW